MQHFLPHRFKQTTFAAGIAMLHLSCKSTNLFHRYQGHYLSQGEGYYISLILKEDSSFSLRENYFSDVSIRCDGKWRSLSKDTLLLHCDDEHNILAALEMGSMSDKILKVVVIGRKKLKIENDIVTRAIDNRKSKAGAHF